VTSWNQFCPVFITLIKTMTEEAKHFCPCSYVKFLGFQCCYQLDSEPVCICMYVLDEVISVCCLSVKTNQHWFKFTLIF